MRVLLAGASGVLGRHMAAALVGSGHEVVGLTRSPGGARRLRDDGVEPLVADLMDRDALLRAVDGQRADAAVHAATALRKVPMRHSGMAATDALRVRGTRNFVEAVQAVGARRLVVESMHLGYGYGDFGDRVITEANTPWAPPGRDAALERHLEGFRVKEQVAFHTAGVEGISLRFGALYGPGYGAGGTEQIVAMLRKRSLPVVSERVRGSLPWTHLADAGTATVAALERGRAGEAYHVVDDESASMTAHVRFLAEAFGTPAPMTVPLWLIGAVGPYLRAFLTSVAHLSNAKARDELGWAPAYPTYRDGIRSLATTR
ncbi:nucleoside-diphosphate sugar epimerase [Asanoa ishikariensis]|uniref:Nucleoside-diphosphate-sugar epimerase n=1 Tax=Asanoa ishikariensis TaxID=137265 RepID=A0A1H3RXG2_9ACTN|nr:NAD(P)-dependent oxidoreductase [Asanoa ishikariensis]GIF66714.1 nucleoside-diphosphate sugar epimerase [Asanoa ishikariensis]SDZ30406.1 Nucleoside-diphosphate-sugar epimerase [Asanoa ishikariensis]